MNRDMFNPHRSLRFGSLRGRDVQGNMDYYMFQRKYEPPTSDYDKDDYLWNYYRGELRSQFGDNAYPLEADNIPYNNYAKYNLSFRHTGSLTGKTPLIYDGDWTYHDMIKDPRGWTNEPLWQEMRRMNENRFWNQPFTDSLRKDLGDIQDPHDRNEAMKWWYDYMRGTHYTMFGTSEENLIKGGPPGDINKHTIGEKIAHQIARTGEKTMFHKSTTNLSNDMTIAGYRSIPGHKYDVPRYGILYGMGPLSDRKTAMALTKFENVFGNQRLMSTVSKSLRKLSEQRSILLNYLSDNIKTDSKASANKKSVGLVADMLSLMGFTIHDLADKSKEQDVKKGNKLTMPPDVKRFVESLYNMPDSRKMDINGSILMHLSGALSDTRKGAFNLQYTQQIKELKESMIKKTPVNDLQRKINNVITKIKDTGKENILNKNVENKLEGGVNKHVSVFLKDTSKHAPNYKQAIPGDVVRLQPEMYLPDEIMKLMPKKLRERVEDPRLNSQVELPDNIDHIMYSQSITANNEHKPFNRPEQGQEINEFEWEF